MKSPAQAGLFHNLNLNENDSHFGAPSRPLGKSNIACYELPDENENHLHLPAGLAGLASLTYNKDTIKKMAYNGSQVPQRPCR